LTCIEAEKDAQTIAYQTFVYQCFVIFVMKNFHNYVCIGKFIFFMYTFPNVSVQFSLMVLKTMPTKKTK